jgi:site-specific DNA-methyltransferase (adenine-specific)
MELNKIYCIDSLEFMKTLPDKCIDLVLTDPPYGINAHEGTGRSLRKAVASGKIISGGDWDSKTPEQEYFDEIFRISKYQVIFGGNYFNLPTSKSFIIWDKGETMYNRDFAECELAWVTPDKPAKIFKKSPTDLKRFHPTQKPLELFRWILKNYSKEGDIIFDPYLGSGTTAIACVMDNRNYIGCEISSDYVKIAEDRISNSLF